MQSSNVVLTKRYDMRVFYYRQFLNCIDCWSIEGNGCDLNGDVWKMKRCGRAPGLKMPAFFCGRAEEDLHDIQYS